MAPQQALTTRTHERAGVKTRKGISAQRTRQAHSSHPAVLPRFRPPTRPRINGLPNELLADIFVLSLPASLANPTPGSGQEFVAYMRRAEVRDYPNLLGRVCRRWHAVALASRVLHACIFLHLDVHYISSQKRHAANTYYGTFLERSGTLPLTMSIDALTQEHIRQLLSAPFVAHLPRLRHISVAIDYATTSCGPFSVLPFLPNVRTPLLETMHLDVCCQDNDWRAKNVVVYFDRVTLAAGDFVQPDLRILHHAPRLTSFSLDHFGDASFTPMLLQKAGLDFLGLTCLRLPEVQCHSLDIYELLVALPRLSSLRCAIRDGYESPPRLDQLLSPGIPLERYEDDEGGAPSRNATMRRRRTSRGELVLPSLVELHITLVSDGFVIYAPESNAFKHLMDLLILPGLTTFAVSRRDIYTDDFDYDEMDDPRIEELSSVLVRPLQSLVDRSGCAIRHLTLDIPYPDCADICEVLRALPTITELELDTIFCREELPRALARRTQWASGMLGQLDLLPHLRRLTIGNCDRSRSDYWEPPLKAILDMIEARWPVGWSTYEVAHVHVDVVQKSMGWDRRARGKVYDQPFADVQERLERIRARGDIDLGIEGIWRDY